MDVRSKIGYCGVVPEWHRMKAQSRRSPDRRECEMKVIAIAFSESRSLGPAGDVSGIVMVWFILYAVSDANL